jgi:MFS family permease
MDRAAIAALRRSHGYPQFLVASTVARVADEMFGVAGVLLILDRTGSPSLAGVTIAAATLPGIVSGPVIGAWLDRTGRRSLIYKVDRVVLAGVLLLILAAAGNAPDFVVPLLALFAGVTLPITSSGFTSMIPLLVEEEMLPPANALEAASLNTSLIAGPALAGLISALAGPPAAIVTEVALTLVALVLILWIPDLDRGGTKETLPLRRLVQEGLRHIQHERVLLIANAAQAVNNCGWGVLMIVFPLWAAADLGSGHSASGALWAAFSLGSLIGAMTLTRLHRRYSAELILFVSLVVTGLGMLTWGLADSLVVALILLTATALIEGPAITSALTLRQQRTPIRLLAQVQATLTSLQVTAFAIGAAIGGPLVVALGPRTSIVVVASAVALAGISALAIRAALPDRAAPESARSERRREGSVQ